MQQDPETRRTASASLDQVLITEALSRRQSRPADFEAECRALHALTRRMAMQPETLLKELVRIALDLCKAETAGISLLETTPGGDQVCRWIAAHDEARKFDAEDARVMGSMAAFTATAPQISEANEIGRPYRQARNEIDKRQRAEAALRHSENFRQWIMDSTRDCIKVLDLEGRLLWINEAGECALEIQDLADVLNSPWIEFWQGDDREQAGTAIAAAIERKRAEAALKDADRRKNEFLAMLAHELRNPLANAVQLLRQPGLDEVAAERARNMMARQLAQMVRLIDDLMDVSRITRSKLTLREERVDLVRVVQCAVESVRPLAEGSGQTLTITTPGEPVYLNADAIRLAQVFSNLLNNAIKYTRPGGRIWLTVETEGQEAVARVQDDGIGISAEVLPRIFDMFTQDERALEDMSGGLGIGLILVRQLVEMHGGLVEARSAGSGGGSEFIVHLPLIEESGPEQPQPQPQPSKPDEGDERGCPAKCRILVVDDNLDSADNLAMLLRVMGNEVHIAHDGLAAVDATAALRPDMVLLDIGLPRLSGYDAARRIREQDWGKRTPLVAFTGWGQPEDKGRAFEAGFDLHLTKPVELATLERLLADLQSDLS